MQSTPHPCPGKEPIVWRSQGGSQVGKSSNARGDTDRWAGRKGEGPWVEGRDKKDARECTNFVHVPGRGGEIRVF